MSDPLRPTRPAVFAVTIIPFAAAVGYASITAPYWLAREGVSLTVIGALSGSTLSPHGLKVLWAPLIDLVWRRKTWFVGMTVLTAATLCALALLEDLSRHLATFAVLTTACNVFGTTAAAAADGLMAATTRLEDQGKAGGWRMAGNVGMTGILGALGIKIASATSVRTAGLLLAAVVLLSALVSLAIHEPKRVREATAAGAAALHRLKEIGADLWRTVISRDGWTGLVICLMPVGAGALTNLFSAMGVDYRASEDAVAVVNGILGGIAGALGAVAGGYLADRMNRRLAYALAGGITALSALAMLLAPLTQVTYVWGTLAYNFANGIAFASLAALILEMVGHSPGAATKYTAFIAVSNVASSYVTFLDGLGSELGGLGVRGTLLADVGLTAAGIGVLVAMVAVTRRSGAGLARPEGGV
ncbi:MAG TPA: MFS transporter [Anaeromyxobacter sp.]|nr:MFS transporter [Anaeromyxobacter sp.]